MTARLRASGAAEQRAGLKVMPLLSVCIPTFQRREGVAALVDVIIAADPDVEICVHVDGSVDGTYDALSARAEREPRLRVSRAENRGRAHALAAAFQAARGEFVMFYDDDDDIEPDGLRHILKRLREPLPKSVCGYVFQMSDDSGQALGQPLPVRSNFLRLRADEGITGDKKEVVRRDLLEGNFYMVRRARRVPTSTLWTRLALNYDVIGDNTIIGRKHYLVGGYSDRIRRLKQEYPGPMARVNAYRALGFLLGRYRSTKYFVRSVAGLVVYVVNGLIQSVRLRAAQPSPTKARHDRV